MSLIRLTDRKLAANRANAQKSTGPRTTAGKAISAQNNAIHCLYARKYTIPPEWEAEISARAAELTLPFADPVERDLRCQWTYIELWIKRLDILEARLCDLEIQNAGNHVRRGIAAWVHANPLFRAWVRRFRQLTRRSAQLFREVKAYCRSRQTQTPAPAPKVMAASADRTHIYLIPNGREFYSVTPGPLLTSFQQPNWVFSL